MSCVCVVGICGRAGWATALLSAKAGGEIRKGGWEALRGVGRCGGRGRMSGRDGWGVGGGSEGLRGLCGGEKRVRGWWKMIDGGFLLVCF